jgi:hypothetical protein
MLNGLAQHKSMSEIAAAGGLPLKLNYTSGKTKVLVSLFDVALFFQDDWKVNQFLTFSSGLRWESQNRINDHSDFGPRLSFAYALDGHKDRKQAKTVLRGGYGFFYDRFRLSNYLNSVRFDGGANTQTQFTVSNPTCFDPNSMDSILANPAQCGTLSALAKTVVQISPTYKSPYTGQFSASLERQLSKTISGTVTYMHSYGVHQMVTRNANAYLPGTYVYGDPTKPGVRPDPTSGIIQQYYPQGIFKQNQVIMNVNARVTRSFNAIWFSLWATTLTALELPTTRSLLRNLGGLTTSHLLMISRETTSLIIVLRLLIHRCARLVQANTFRPAMDVSTSFRSLVKRSFPEIWAKDQLQSHSTCV